MPTELEIWLLFGYFACLLLECKKEKWIEFSLLRYNLVISK